MLNNRYIKQAELLLRTLPYIAREEVFALKGGTAINFFWRDFPRMSVDIDNKKIGEEYIFNFCWPDTQFDDEEIKELMGRQYENYFGEES